MLWLRRDYAVGQPHFTLADLAKLDDQLDAQVDGLRIADAGGDDAGWMVCERELKWGEPGEVFPAAILAYESGKAERIEAPLEAGTATYENSRALASAFAWPPYEQMAKAIQPLLASNDATLRRVALAATAAHRRDPGPLLLKALEDPDDCLRARALRAVGELGRSDLRPQLHYHMQEIDPRISGVAAWSAALLEGDDTALTRLRGIVELCGSESERALQLLMRRMRVGAAQEWLNDLVQQSGTVSEAQDSHAARFDERRWRLAVQGTGLLGTPDSVPWLLSVMQVPQLARIAGEAFTMITGLAVNERPYEGEWPDGFAAGPTEDPDDDNVGLDPDENLPWPNRDAVMRWWHEHEDAFEPGTRYLTGQPLTEDWPQHVLRHGYQRAHRCRSGTGHPSSRPTAL